MGLIQILSDVRVWRGMREGIPTIEITIGHYLRDWEIADRWEKVQERMERARALGVRVLEEKRTEDGHFRSYKVVADDVTQGRL